MLYSAYCPCMYIGKSLLIGAGNMQYMIKINTISQMPFYDEEKEELVRNPLYVARENGRCGIVDRDGDILLPFEYEHITIIGFGVLLLVQNGRMGLVHLDTSGSEETIYIARHIPCNYDYIDTEYAEGVFLLHTYSLRDHSVCAYLTKPRVLTRTYTSAAILDRRLMELRQDNKCILINVRTGKKIFDNGPYTSMGSYRTPAGVVLHQFSEDDTRLLFLGKNKRKMYVIPDHCAQVIMLYALDEDSDAKTVVFVAETQDGLVLIDGECNQVTSWEYQQILIQTVIKGIDAAENTVLLSVGGQTVLKDLYVNVSQYDAWYAERDNAYLTG